MKYTIEYVKRSFEKEGYTLLSQEYVNNKQKLDYVCSEGHKHKVTWSDWKNRNIRCPYCKGRPIYTIEDVRKAFEAEGYKLLTTEYVNNKQKLEYTCPNGHEYTICYSSWLQGRRCYLCNGNVKKDLEFIKKKLQSEGYVLKSEMYEGCQEHLLVMCPNGHTYKMTWDNWNSKYSRCPSCSNKGISKEELFIVDFLKSNTDSEVLLNDRTVCKPKEIDMLLPEHKLAIEYCGLYWHSELLGKDSNYHINKTINCYRYGYQLITIFSDEFNNKHQLCLDRLLSYVNTANFNRIFARKCYVKEISARHARIFCEKNHLQGYGSGSSIKLGLFYNGELVAVMTFSKPSLAKGHKEAKEGVWELHRFCSKLNTQVIGGASKLLKYFERNFEWTELFSYADRRWSVGTLYEKLGFTFDKITQPNYWYIKDQCYNRINRFSLRKTSDEPKDVSEWELRKAQGYNRIWDCGNLKYIKYNK